MFNLIDDGTLDTVLLCEECNEEQRYNFSSWYDDDIKEELTEQERMDAYDSFIDGIIAESNSEHSCQVVSFSEYVEQKIVGELD